MMGLGNCADWKGDSIMRYYPGIVMKGERYYAIVYSQGHVFMYPETFETMQGALAFASSQIDLVDWEHTQTWVHQL